MRFLALATDYDGTIADGGRVDAATADALARLRSAGLALVIVTGRRLDDLLDRFPQARSLDRVVAENGAVLWAPGGEPVLLAEPPPEAVVGALRDAGVAPLSQGRVILATGEPNEQRVLRVIRDLGLEMEVILNRGAVMVLPAGVTKASGLAAALASFDIPARATVAVGDAENDHALLAGCGLGVAVANAVPALRERADLVTAGARGAGVVELVERLLDG